MKHLKDSANGSIFVAPVLSHQPLLDRHIIVSEWYDYSLEDGVKKLDLNMEQRKHICYGVI